MTSIVTPINADYEFLQYNEQLRIIHSISDDMFQIKSIIDSCNSDKRVNDWLDNKTTKELLKYGRAEISASEKLYENRPNLSNELRGYYVHRLLVNHIAIWCSPAYSWQIMKLLDSYFNQQRIQLQNQLNEKQNQLNEKQNQINNITPRVVPNNREHDYKYLIWLEQIPDDNANVKLHLVRRHKDYFYKVRSHYDDLNERWFFRENLPISMTINLDIKNIIRENFDETEANINGNTITINREILDDLHEMIETYFDEFQE